MSSDSDQEVACLKVEYAALKIEHAGLTATPHTARELEAHVAKLRVHIQRLQACIEQIRERSTPDRDSAVSASEGRDTSSPATAFRAEPVVKR